MIWEAVHDLKLLTHSSFRLHCSLYHPNNVLATQDFPNAPSMSPLTSVLFFYVISLDSLLYHLDISYLFSRFSSQKTSSRKLFSSSSYILENSEWGVPSLLLLFSTHTSLYSDFYHPPLCCPGCKICLICPPSSYINKHSVPTGKLTKT